MSDQPIDQAEINPANKHAAEAPDRNASMAGGNGHAPPLPGAVPELDVPFQASASASYGYGSNVLGDPEHHLADYLKVLVKRRWTAITAFLLVFVSVTVYTFTATPIYEVRAQLLIEKENSNVVTFKEAFEQNQITDDYYQTQYKILQSRALARRTLDALKFWNAPLLGGGAAAGIANFSLLRPSTWMRGIVPSANAPARVPDVDETKAQSRVIDQFLAGLTVSPIRNSRLVDLKYDSTDPLFATTVTNALAQAYIAQNLEFKFMASKEASDWLGQQLGEQRAHVEASEQALQKYREQTDSGALEEKQNIVGQKLADLNAAVTRAKTERIQKQALYDQVVAIQDDPAALDSVTAILSNTFIQQQKLAIAELQRQQVQFSEKMGPNHPDMLKLSATIRSVEIKVRAEVTKVVASLKNDYQASLAQEQSLQAALDAQKGSALALSRKGINYGVLERDASSNRQIFDSLMQRTKETGISGELRTSNIRVIDPAEVPRGPASPNKVVNLAMAVFGGIVTAFGFAFFFEYMDSRIKTPDELKTYLGLPFLGMVPSLSAKAAASPLINNGVPQNFAEAFRAVRTNVLFSTAHEGGRSIAVTSTGPGEGKTLVSSNLAIALAQAGERVLLVDGDMRKPRVHTMLGLTQEPGLSNLLVGTVKPSAAIRKTGVPNLWAIPAGVNPPNPTELLGAKRFKEFLSTMSEFFDWVILDTPPVMAVTDSCVVAHATHGVLFVVGAEMTSRHAAARAIEQIQTAKGRFIGGVLNRVDLHHNPYYYSQYYRREYATYYGTT
jgi:polysaccharide biosynthesis transport protein